MRPPPPPSIHPPTHPVLLAAASLLVLCFASLVPSHQLELGVWGVGRAGHALCAFCVLSPPTHPPTQPSGISLTHSLTPPPPPANYFVYDIPASLKDLIRQNMGQDKSDFEVGG